MSPTRRDVIKLASALCFTGAAPTTAERIAAVHALDQEISPRTVLDPAGFARDVDGILSDKLDDDWLSAINPVERAAYVQARDTLMRTVLALAGEEGLRRYGDWDAAAFTFIMGAYAAGLRHGAAYEHLRRS